MARKVKKVPKIFEGIEEHNGVGVIYGSNNHYSFVLKLQNPVNKLSGDKQVYYDLHNTLNSAIKVLAADDGYTIQKLDMFSTHTFDSAESTNPAFEGDYLSGEYFKHFEGRSYKVIETYLVITRKFKSSGYIKMTFNVEQRFTDFLNVRSKITSVLNNGGFKCQTLSAKQIDLLSLKLLSFNFSKPACLSQIEVTPTHVEINDQVVISQALIDIEKVDLPGELKPMHNSKVAGLDFPTDMMSFLHEIKGYDDMLFHQVIRIPQQTIKVEKLNLKRKRHDGIPDPTNNFASEDIQRLMDAMTRHSDLIIECHFSIAVKATKDKAHKAMQDISTKLLEMSITPSDANYNQLEMFLSFQPGNGASMKDYNYFDTISKAALCLFFCEALPQGNPESNFQIYFTDRQGRPLPVDTNLLPKSRGEIDNYNKFVLGPSGSGKSFFMNNYVRQHLLHGTDVVMVDTGNSYWGLNQYYNGEYITYTPENPITMNPFDFSMLEWGEEKSGVLESLIGVAWKGANGVLSKVEATVIRRLLDLYYKDVFDPASIIRPSFNSFYEYAQVNLERACKNSANGRELSVFDQFDDDQFYFVLSDFYNGGKYDLIFNKESDSRLFDAPFIVFEIDNIKDNPILFPLTTLIIMDVFIQKMRNKSNRKALIIEEAWKAIASPMMANYILYLFKTVRKFDGEAIVVTQELSDIIGNTIVKDAIISNADTIILLDQFKFRDNFTQIADLLSLNEVERRKIFTINRLENKENRSFFKECYIKSGAKGTVYGIEVSLAEYLTFTTDSIEKSALKVYHQIVNNQYRKSLNWFISDFETHWKQVNPSKNQKIGLILFCQFIVQNKAPYTPIIKQEQP